MNKKPIYTDFLNAQWKPVPMFYGFKPNVRPYILPRNRGKLPMPKSGHIQFGEVAAIAKAEFNPLPHYQELQLPGKMFSSVPAPQQKFLNAATVTLINSGKVKAQFRADQKINPLSMPIVGQMANNNLKLISLEMIKNAVVGLKRDPTLGTEQQQLQARTSYDNLIVSYAALVDRKQDDPENVKKLIAQYEKEMIAIYGPSIKKAVPEDVLNSVVDKIKEVDSSLARLYTLIQTNAISKPAVEGDLVPGEFGEEEEEEVEVKGPDPDPDLPPPYEEREAEEEALAVKPPFVKIPDADIVAMYKNDANRTKFVGDTVNNNESSFNDLLQYINTTTWVKKQKESALMMRNLLFELVRRANFYNERNKSGRPPLKLPSVTDLNNKATRAAIIGDLPLIFQDVVQNMLLDRAEAAKAQAGPQAGPKVQLLPKARLPETDRLLSAFLKKPKFDLITEIRISADPDALLTDFFDAIGELDTTNPKTRTILRQVWVNLDELSSKPPHLKSLAPPKDRNADALSTPAKFKTTLDNLRKAATDLLAAEIAAAAAPPQQGAPGRKRKSRKRPVIKSVKKLSPNINDAIMRLLKS